MITLHLGCYNTMNPSIAFLICRRRGQVGKGPFRWFLYFNVYQNQPGSYTFQQTYRWFWSRWSEGTLGNSARKSHAGLLNQSIKGHGPGTSIFTGTPAHSQAPWNRSSPCARETPMPCYCQEEADGVGRIFWNVSSKTVELLVVIGREFNVFLFHTPTLSICFTCSHPMK